MIYEGIQENCSLYLCAAGTGHIGRATRGAVHQRCRVALPASTFICRHCAGRAASNAGPSTTVTGGATRFAIVVGLDIETAKSIVDSPRAANEYLSIAVKVASTAGAAVCSRPGSGARFSSNVRGSLSSLVVAGFSPRFPKAL